MNEHYVQLQESIGEKLGTKIRIKGRKLEISFANDNDLNRLLEIMKLN